MTNEANPQNVFELDRTSYHVSRVEFLVKPSRNEPEKNGRDMTLIIHLRDDQSGLFMMDRLSCKNLCSTDDIKGARIHAHCEDDDDDYDDLHADDSFDVSLRDASTSGWFYGDDGKGGSETEARLIGLNIDFENIGPAQFRIHGSFEVYDLESDEPMAGKLDIVATCRFDEAEG